MKTIQTKPDCTLGFVKIPEIKLPDGHKENVLRFSKAFLSDYDGGKANPFLIDEIGLTMQNDKLEAIGKLSEITEEQARELVIKSENAYEVYGDALPKLAPYGTGYEIDGYKIYALNAIHSLQSAALSVGIEEKDFDKYLVVRV